MQTRGARTPLAPLCAKGWNRPCLNQFCLSIHDLYHVRQLSLTLSISWHQQILGKSLSGTALTATGHAATGDMPCMAPQKSKTHCEVPLIGVLQLILRNS